MVATMICSRTEVHTRYPDGIVHLESGTKRDYVLRPSSLYRPRPLIYVGGESEPARALVADHGDVWFINGQPLEDVAGLIADVAGHRAIADAMMFVDHSTVELERLESERSAERRRASN